MARYSNYNTLCVHQDSPLIEGDIYSVKMSIHWRLGRRFHGLEIKSWHYDGCGGKVLCFDWNEWLQNNPENPFKDQVNSEVPKPC